MSYAIDDRMNSLVSVVVPFYNRIDVTIRAIDSVYTQTYKNIEVIVVNDGSECDDSELIKRYKNKINFKYYKLPSNMGPSAARNIGIYKSEGEYIAFLDSDDVWHTDKLMIQINWMKNNNYLFTHSSYIRKNQNTGNSKIMNSGAITYWAVLIPFICRIATPTVIVNRAFLGNNKFREDLRYGEDILLWLQLARISPIYGYNKPIVTVFVNEDTAAHNYEIQKNVLKMIGREGSGNSMIRFIHYGYRQLRFLIYWLKINK